VIGVAGAGAVCVLQQAATAAQAAAARHGAILCAVGAEHIDAGPRPGAPTLAVGLHLDADSAAAVSMFEGVCSSVVHAISHLAVQQPNCFASLALRQVAQNKQAAQL
jgi:hypothetical protein